MWVRCDRHVGAVLRGTSAWGFPLMVHVADAHAQQLKSPHRQVAREMSGVAPVSEYNDACVERPPESGAREVPTAVVESLPHAGVPCSHLFTHLCSVCLYPVAEAVSADHHVRGRVT